MDIALCQLEMMFKLMVYEHMIVLVITNEPLGCVVRDSHRSLVSEKLFIVNS